MVAARVALLLFAGIEGIWILIDCSPPRMALFLGGRTPTMSRSSIINLLSTVYTVVDQGCME